MKENNLILRLYFIFITFCLLTTGFAQEGRYLNNVFSGSEVERDIVYGNNVTVLASPPEPADLLMDVYKPIGDSATNRPVWIVLHTGSFLPPLFNGQITGARSDSTVVNICKRLNALGYVAVAATYRLGWLPTAADQDTRTGTLLQAAYRGIQDTRTCIRFLRKSIEEGNPYGIDPNRIGVWGVGTGSYLAFGAGTLDDPEEVLLPKFLNSNDNTPLADTALLGNFDGTTPGQIGIPNHVGYNSDFDICVNLGGAMGDISWLDGKENEPAFVGFHSTRDIFAPFADGAVIVPTTQQFVVNVSGTRTVIDSANSYGNNDILNAIPTDLDPLNPRIQAYKAVDVTFPGGQTIKLGTDHFYPFVTSGFEGSPWDWWGFSDLQQVVAGTNAALGTTFSADTLHGSGLLTNPDMSAEKGNRYLDTIFAVTVPRAYYAFGLDSLGTSTTTLRKSDVSLTLSPNPSPGHLNINSHVSHPMRNVRIRDIQGKLITDHRAINASRFEINHNNISPGTYLIEIRFDKGVVTEKIIFE